MLPVFLFGMYKWKGRKGHLYSPNLFLQLDFLRDFIGTLVESTDFLYDSLSVQYNLQNTNKSKFREIY